MKRAAAGLALILVVGVASTYNGATSARKCTNTAVRFPSAPEPLFLLDGTVVEAARMQDIKADSITWVAIVCADALYQRFRVEAQRTGVVIFTAPGAQAALEEQMRRVERLQQEYFTRHGTFARTLTDLGWNDASEVYHVRLTASADGKQWSATGTHVALHGKQRDVTVSGSAD